MLYEITIPGLSVSADLPSIWADHDRLDVAQQISFDLRKRRKKVEGRGLGIDLGEPLVHLRRHDRIDRDAVQRKRPRLDRARVARIV